MDNQRTGSHQCHHAVATLRKAAIIAPPCPSGFCSLLMTRLNPIYSFKTFQRCPTGRARIWRRRRTVQRRCCRRTSSATTCGRLQAMSRTLGSWCCRRCCGAGLLLCAGLRFCFCGAIRAPAVGAAVNDARVDETAVGGSGYHGFSVLFCCKYKRKASAVMSNGGRAI